MKTKLLAMAICVIAFFSADLAYGYYPVSPYAYANNNPVRYVDPDGKKWVDTNGNPMWQNGQWTKHATPDAMRVGIAMRATETGMKMFDHVANSSAAVQIAISPDIKVARDEHGNQFLTRGDFNPTGATLDSNGKVELQSGIITIYEGSIKAEINGTIPTSDETGKLIKSLPTDIAVNGAIGSVGVHESTHSTPENMKQQYENGVARKNKQPEPHNVETKPVELQNQYLRELLKK